MDKNGNQLKIIQAIVNLTHRLGVDVIAEGIETNDQLDELKDLECKFGQGYLIYKPLDKEEVKRLLSEMSNADQAEASPSALPVSTNSTVS